MPPTKITTSAYSYDSVSNAYLMDLLGYLFYDHMCGRMHETDPTKRPNENM